MTDAAPLPGQATAVRVAQDDPVLVRIVWDRLLSIVDQATAAHKRTAFSTLVREANDLAATLLTRSGETIVSAPTGLPPFTAAPAFALRHLLTVFPPESLADGDVLISNDPWIGAGHPMDIVMIRPIFVDQRLVAFAGSMAHSPDLGGAQRWNRSIDVFDEALRIPHIKLFEGGHPNTTLLTVIQHNSRVPDLTMGDLEAQITSLNVLATEVTNLLHEYRLSDLDVAFEQILSRSENVMREAISAIPDGRYEGAIESDGYPDPRAPDRVPEPFTIHVTVTVAGSEVHLDFSGSSPTIPGSFNGVGTICEAYASYGLRVALVPFLPNNDGLLRPIKVTCPVGTVVNSEFPAPTLARHVVASQVCDPVFRALAPVIPDRLIAPSGNGPPWGLLVMGLDEHEDAYYRFLIISGGHGATSEMDGYTVPFPGNISNTPVETMEALMPIVWECKEIIPDSGGTGKHRGGPGQRMIGRATRPVGFSIINGRVEHAPLGLLQGGSGRPGIFTAGGRPFRPGTDGTLAPGEAFVIETPGGGGLGAASGRARSLIAHDVEDGLVSAEAVAAFYPHAVEASDG